MRAATGLYVLAGLAALWLLSRPPRQPEPLPPAAAPPAVPVPAATTASSDARPARCPVDDSLWGTCSHTCP
jgi:hypothetical protein